MNIDLTKIQQYLEWLKNKLYLNAIASSAKNRIVYRGQVYRCNLGIGIGSEECKERPCVVLHDLDLKQRQLDKFQKLLDSYHFADIQNLADFLEKSLKEM